MSIKIMGAIWDLELPRNQQIILLAMADHADHQGGNVYPSVGLIAWKTGYSEAQTRRIIAGLVKDGLLKKEKTRAGKTTVYRIVLSAGKERDPYHSYDTPSIAMIPLASDDTPPLASDDRGTPSIAVTGEPSLNHQLTVIDAPEKSDAQTAPKIETTVATEKPKKPRTEKQLANDAMGNAIALAYYEHSDFDKFTKSVKSTIGKVNRELREAGYKPEDVQHIHAFIEKASRKGGDWDWSLHVYPSYADKWRAQKRRRDTATTAAALTTPDTTSKPRVMEDVFTHDEKERL